MAQVLETINHTYKVINWQRKDGLYNVYVEKTSNNSGAYIGEATVSIGVKEKMTLSIEDVINLRYEIY